MRSLLGRGALFSFAIFYSGASATDANDMYIAKGIGTVSCGTWINYVNTRETNNETLIEQWILGYVTSYNLYMWKYSKDIADETDADGLLLWTKGYCFVHPLDTVVTAVDRLITELGTRYFQKHPKPAAKSQRPQ